jgi:hypothetical protein
MTDAEMKELITTQQRLIRELRRDNATLRNRIRRIYTETILKPLFALRGKP